MGLISLPRLSRTNRCRHINHCCDARWLRATNHSIAKVLSRSTTRTEPAPSIGDSIWSGSRHCPLCTAARGPCLTLCPLLAKVKSRPVVSVQVLQVPSEFRNPMNGIAPWTHSTRRPTWKYCTTRQARTRALALSRKTNHFHPLPTVTAPASKQQALRGHLPLSKIRLRYIKEYNFIRSQIEELLGGDPTGPAGQHP